MSDNRFRKNAEQHSYQTFDFERFDKAGLKLFRSKLTRAGVNIAEVDASNKSRRMDGQPIKKAIFSVEGGQTVELAVTNEGDLYQVKINKKVTPIKSMQKHGTLAKDIAAALGAAEPAFKKAQARKAQKATSNTPKKLSQAVSVTAAKQIVAVKERLATIEKSNATQETQLVELKDKGEGLSDKLREVRELLVVEQRREHELRKQLAEIGVL